MLQNVPVVVWGARFSGEKREYFFVEPLTSAQPASLYEVLIGTGSLTEMPTVDEEEDIDHTIAVIMGLDVVLLTAEENSQSTS